MKDVDTMKDVSFQSTQYSVLIATEKTFPESELAQRLSESCNVVLAHDLSNVVSDITIRAVPFSAYLIDTATIDEEIIECVSSIRSLDSTGSAPIILIVSNTTDEHIEKGFQAGATDVLVRPYSIYAHRRVLNYIRLHEMALEFKASRAQLEHAQEEIEEMLGRMPGGLFRYRASYEPGEDIFDYVSPGLVQMTGCKDEAEFRAYTGNTFRSFVHPEDRERVLAEINEQASATGSDRVTYRIICKNGEIRWLEDWGNLVTDSKGQPWFYVVVLDITEKMDVHDTLKYQAEHDSLTGAYNRESAMQYVIDRRANGSGTCSVLFIDIDNFKEFNDTHGHPFGDEVLKHLVNYLNHVLREDDIVARLGGDEFVVYLVGLGEGSRLRYLVNRITKLAFSNFNSRDFIDEEVVPTVSIGVASTESLTTTLSELYAHSDAALYIAKSKGKNTYWFYNDTYPNLPE